MATDGQLRQEVSWKPWQVVAASMTADAALLTAGAATGGFIIAVLLRH